MPSFAESFVRGHARGSQEMRAKERQQLDEAQFEEQKKRNAEEAARHKQDAELQKAIADLNYQFKLSDLRKTQKRPTTTAADAGIPEQPSDLFGGPMAKDVSVPAQVPPQMFDATALGGEKTAVQPMFAEDVAAQALAAHKATGAADLDLLRQKNKVNEETEGFVLANDIPQLGLKKGTRVNPAQLAAQASVFSAQEATKRKAESGLDSGQADYLADQVLGRKIEYRSLGREQKDAVAAALSAKGMDIPRPISAKEREAGNNAAAGLAALDRVDALLEKNPHLPLAESANLPGLFGAPARAAIPGLSEFSAAKREAVDVITRLRTGAALNKQEEAFYPQQVVQPGDSAQAIAMKHNQLRAFYLGMTGVPVKVISPDGRKSKIAQDMFDPKQRLGIRKLVNAGWKLEY